MYIPAVAILFGILSTVVLHIAKAMERHGIVIFDNIRARIKKDDSIAVEKGMKKPAIYIIGLIMNNTVPLWAMLSNMFSDGDGTFYTSMFGVGLIALMFYSRKFLGENITRIEFIGSIVLIVGTLILGIELIFRKSLITVEPNLTAASAFLVVFGIISVAVILYMHKRGSLLGVGLFFGLVAGTCGGLDPAFKGIGQSLGVESAGFLPDFGNPAAVIVFIGSFGLGTVAFLLTQWGFAKKARASILVPAYNSAYVVVPIFFRWIVYYPHFTIYPITVVGMTVTVLGIIMMTAFKKGESMFTPHLPSE